MAALTAGGAIVNPVQTSLRLVNQPLLRRRLFRPGFFLARLLFFLQRFRLLAFGGLLLFMIIGDRLVDDLVELGVFGALPGRKVLMAFAQRRDAFRLLPGQFERFFQTRIILLLDLRAQVINPALKGYFLLIQPILLFQPDLVPLLHRIPDVLFLRSSHGFAPSFRS
jgi:hypothetical protein